MQTNSNTTNNESNNLNNTHSLLLDDAGEHPIDTLTMLHLQTRAMLTMMGLYFGQAGDGVDELNTNILENYVGQMEANMSLAERAMEQLIQKLK